MPAHPGRGLTRHHRSEAQDWTDAENEILVADYFAMLGEEMAGRPYVKAHHRRAVVDRIGRSEGSAERKYMNVSAVLKQLGLPRIRCYAPNVNAQFRSLTAAIDRYLSAHVATWEPEVLPSSPLPNEDPFVPPPELHRCQHRFLNPSGA